eukprot:4056543-Pyramimonas_sp.AAC.2
MSGSHAYVAWVDADGAGYLRSYRMTGESADSVNKVIGKRTAHLAGSRPSDRGPVRPDAADTLGPSQRLKGSDLAERSYLG